MGEEHTQRILREKNFHQKKSLGQHFLHDIRVLDAIVDIAGVSPKDAVLEIGPGAGTLTRRLALRVKQVLAVEVDRSLAPVLEEALVEYPNIQVKFADILRVSWESITCGLGDMPIRVVANIPYGITTDILDRLLHASPVPATATLLVQLEAAQRVLAAPGGKEYSPLAIFTALYTRSRMALDVPPSAFLPPPHVDSTVLHMEFLPPPEWPACSRKTLETVVKAAFSARRKQLHNNLRPLFDSREAMLMAFEEAGLEPHLRAEQLTPQDYVHLAACMA